MGIEDRLRNQKVVINVLALLVLVLAGIRVWEQFSGHGEMTVTKLTVVGDEGKEQLVALGVTTGGDGGVWTTTKFGRKKRLD